MTTPSTDGDREAPADASDRRSVTEPLGSRDDRHEPAGPPDSPKSAQHVGTKADGHDSRDNRHGRDAVGGTARAAATAAAAIAALPRSLADMRRRWQPTDNWPYPTLAQQRADAFVALFLGLATDLTTEIVIHVRGDGATFDDGTPTTDSAILRQLDHSFIRLMIHDTQRRPVNASNRRRYPTTAQRRVAMEAHNHECVDCHSTDILELDHNPPYHQTGHTHTDELEPRCAPCHRAHHRRDHAA